jgi:hypothetical protein
MTDHATRFLGQVNRIPVLGPVLAGARVVVPTRYVALHLILGLVATAAIIGFIVIAEEVVAGRTIAHSIVRSRMHCGPTPRRAGSRSSLSSRRSARHRSVSPRRR